MRSVALVTGASTGIGADLARVFARHGHDLALTARSADKLAALADEIASEIALAGRPRPVVIPCDLAAPRAVDEIAGALAAADARVTILVNNAGYGVLGAVSETDAGEQLGIVDVNVRSLLELTLRFLPELEEARGKILNVASMASYMPGPGFAVYYASKHFVSAFSRALTQEMKASRVGVTLLNPGMTRTGFQARAGMGAAIGGLDRVSGADPMSVAEVGYDALMAGRRVVVPGFLNKIGAMVLPLVPDALMLPLLHRFQRVRRWSGSQTGGDQGKNL